MNANRLCHAIEQLFHERAADKELLELFVGQKDEAAFAMLARLMQFCGAALAVAWELNRHPCHRPRTACPDSTDRSRPVTPGPRPGLHLPHLPALHHPDGRG